MKIHSLKKRHLILPGIVLLIVIILFAAPRIARIYIVKNSQELIGRSLSIDKIRINYFTGTLKIKDLRMFETDGINVFVSFKQLKVNLDYLPLLSNEFVVRYINLDDPYIQVLQDDVRFNFSDLTEEDSTIQEKDTIPSEPTKYIINNIRITRGYVKYTDIPINHTISIDSLDLEIPAFTWNTDTASLDIGFKFVEGGGISSGLTVSQSDSTYSLALKIDSLNLGIVEPYVADFLEISDLSGYYSGNLQIKGSISSVLKLFISGQNTVYGFRMDDSQSRNIFSFKNLEFNLDTFEFEKNRLKMNSIRFTDPYVFFELTDSSNNWLALMKDTGEEPVDSLANINDSTAAGSSFNYNIPEIIINGGKIVLEDKSLRYPFRYEIDDLNLNLKEKSDAPGKIAEVLSARLNGTGSVSSEGLVNQSDPANDIDLSLEIKNFRMGDVDAYFKHYFGFPVKGGIMNLSTANKMRPGSLESENHIYFRRFTLDRKLPDKTEYKVPLRLAIGVLSDKDGIIDLKAPVKMKGDDVKILNLGKIIFRVIGNLFVKAALSPFNLLSDLSGVDEESLKEIRFNLTDENPVNNGLKSLDILSDILNKKPLLNMDLIYCLNRDKAIDSLAYMYVSDEFLSSEEGKMAERDNIADSTLKKFMIGKNPSDSLSITNEFRSFCTDYAGANFLNSRIDSLKILQTEFVRNYLSFEKAIPSNRFTIFEIAPDSLKPSFAYPSFRIYFTGGGGEN